MSQRARSPVLGYNHNVRHGGRVFHVQTEDSGTGYARLYTHLFFEGTILSSKKMEYDPQSPEDAVRSLMQKLHKAMMKELSHAEHDARIAAFFAARGQPARLGDAAVNTSGVVEPPAASDAPAVVAPASTEPMPLEAPVPLAAAPPVAVATPARVPTKPVVVVKPGALKRPPVVLSSSADGVVVRRNVVVNVGGGAPPVNGSTPSPAATAPINGTPPPAARPRVATSGDGMFVGAGAVRLPVAAPRTSAAGQPLASSRDIRMPWETPAPARVVAPIVAAAEPPPPAGTSRELRMPWEAGGPPPPTDAFAADLVNDKSLDEVILEYLSDDGESQ